jgi:hypothetical protein
MATIERTTARKPHAATLEAEVRAIPVDQLRASIIEACAMSDDDLVRQQDSERQAKAAAIAASYNA